MCKKLIIGIVTIVLTIIFGKVKIFDKPKENISSTDEDLILISQIEDNVAEEDMENEVVTEVQEDVIVEQEIEEKQKSETTNEEAVNPKEQKKEEIDALKETSKTMVEATQKQEQVNISEESKVQETKDEVSSKTTITQEEQNTQEEIVKTEEIKYNKDATQQLIDDIDELAKQNPSLWDKNGNKLYKIEKAESLVGQNYMSPYRKQHVAGVVLNVFPVKFLVYAIDVEKDGFTKETRYYIDVASLN